MKQYFSKRQAGLIFLHKGESVKLVFVLIELNGCTDKISVTT